MRRRLEEVRETLREFVDQRDHLMMVVGTTNEEVLYIAQSLGGLDDESPADVYLVFPQPLEDAVSYATAVIASLDAQLAGVNAVIAADPEATAPPLVPLPARCFDPREPPALRLREALFHVQALLPVEEGHRLVWALLPMRVDDRVAFAQVVREILPGDEVLPWMRSVRIVVRDDRHEPFLEPAIAGHRIEGVLVYSPNLSPGAFIDQMAKEVEDEAVPVAERMQHLMQIATLDYAHQRYPDALNKYTVLYAYYTEHEAPVMQALCLGGVGDVLRAVDRVEESLERYQQALAHVAGSQALPVVMNMALAAGDASAHLERFEDALGYFDIVDRVATKLLNPYAKAEALDRTGWVHRRRSDEGPALLTWQTGAELCRGVGYLEKLETFLSQLLMLYEEADMDEEANETEAECRAVRAVLEAAALGGA